MLEHFAGHEIINVEEYRLFVHTLVKETLYILSTLKMKYKNGG